MMSTDAELSFELPADIREGIVMLAAAHGISLSVLVALYKRGFRDQLGATGEHPYGTMGPDDKGELRAALTADHRHGVVRMEFGTLVKWVGLPAAHARHLAQLLLDKADELDRKTN